MYILHPSTDLIPSCGLSSVDDPESTWVYENTLCLIRDKYPNLKDDISLLHLLPSDQLLNALMTKTRIILQLSRYEGFEVKVSEALHRGKPVIGWL
jgi:alpha,alpha-trehalose phosphorylase (configuration-retaining)